MPCCSIEAPHDHKVKPLSWFALYVAAQQERRVESRLDDITVEHYSPFIQRPIRTGQKRSHHKPASPFERTEDPLLPGYVFARFDLLDRTQRHNIISIPGVVRIVGFGLQPVSIPDEEVESLRLIVTAGVSIRSIPLVTGGEYVRVVRGPLTGAQGFVVYVKQGTASVPRIVVSVSMLGRSVSTEVDADWLEQCAAPVGKRKVA